MLPTLRRPLNQVLHFARYKAPPMAVHNVLANTRWIPVTPTANTPAHDIFPGTIEQSPQDERSYKLIRLQNGLQALLVHDKDADNSAASMDIAVGHLHDPDDMPGLAHFCEHMLFLGTKQFPKENAYHEYINASGGHTNAYTDSSNTNYFFSVSSTKTPPSSGTTTPALDETPIPEAPQKSPLPRALEIFASFFHSPLFTASGTNRELNAVDSEHKKNAQNDFWRLYQLSKGLSDDIIDKDGTVRKHPWRKFGTGSRATLCAYGRTVSSLPQVSSVVDGDAKNVDCDPSKPLPALPSETEPDGGPVGIETRRRLMEWWQREYCAGRMKLAVIGRESLEELTQLVTELFSPIPNRGIEPWPMFTDPAFGPKQWGTVIEAKTVMDFRGFDVEFQIPWQTPFYLNKPSDYIAHLVGHEGPGSLHSYLKTKGWITYLNASPMSQGRGQARFGLNGNLTKEGFENREGFLSAVYKYFSMLRSCLHEGYLYEEIKQLAEIHFRFEEKQAADDYAASLSKSLNKPYAREHVLSGRTRVWEHSNEQVTALLDDMVPSKSRVMFCARDFGDNGGEWQKETWYGTEYRIKKMSDELLKEVPNDIKELYLPLKNDFIPTRLDVSKIPVLEPSKEPTRVRDSPMATLWHKKDDQFWVPRAVFYASIISPPSHITPRHSIKTKMYTYLVNDALTEYSYAASLAGLHYEFSTTNRGITFSVGGYNDKIAVLAKTVLDKIKNIKIDPARFAVMKEDIIQEYENFYLQEPFRYADYLMGYLMFDNVWTPKEKLEELKTLTVEEVQSHIQQLFSRTYIEAMAHGNITSEEGSKMLDMTESILGSQALTPLEKLHLRSFVLPTGAKFVYQTNVPNPKEVNSCLVYRCQVGEVSRRELSSLNSLLIHMMREPAFDELRTKQQLGYIVFLSRVEGRSMFGLQFVVQSERDPLYLESCVETFLTAYRERLHATKPEEFERQKEGLISAKLQKLENLYKETARFWSHIDNGYLDFRRHEHEVEIIRKASLEDVVKYFDTYINPSSLERRKISVHLRSQNVTNQPVLKFSVAASNAYLEVLKSHNIPVEEEQYNELSKAEPPVEAVEAFWTDHLNKVNSPNISDDVRETLLKAISQLATVHAPPAVDTSKVELQKGTSIIENIGTFKASLPLGPAAVPLAVSKL